MDPRITNQQKYLTSATTLTRQIWNPSVQASDHQHCSFCWTTFAAPGIRGAIQAGYATVDGQYWICDGCFDDFKGAFDWDIV